MKKTIFDLEGFEDICNEKILSITNAGCSTIIQGPEIPVGPGIGVPGTIDPGPKGPGAPGPNVPRD